MGRRILALLVAATALAGLAAAYAERDGRASGSSPRGGGAKQGGDVTVASVGKPDFLDPALGYTVAAYLPMGVVYTPLLTYRHTEGQRGAELVPGLARSLPQVLDGGRTYRLRLRDGLQYSDGRPVRASDFEHTIKRVLRLKSGGSSFFLGIVGAEQYAGSKRPESDISGIRADDATGTITIRLKGPDATFSNVLAMNFAALVPSGTPFRNLSRNPPPGVGPYRFTESQPSRRYVLEKNPRFNVSGLPKGNVDTITTRVITSSERATQEVIRNRIDFMWDPPAPDLIAQIRRRYADRYREYTANATDYIWMNSRVPPFDKKAVRRAVHFAIDKRALVRIAAGLAEPTCNFLPPNMPGYRRLQPCPFGNPEGGQDVNRARRLIRQAGAEKAPVTVWLYSEVTGPKIGSYYVDVLNQIGLRAKLKLLGFGTLGPTLGNQRTRAQTGFLGWVQDFPHPANFMFLVNGATIQPENNQNFSNTNDPVINAGIERLRRAPNLQRVKNQWARLDRRVVEEAYLIPTDNPKFTAFMSERMNFKDCLGVHPVLIVDYASFCLK